MAPALGFIAIGADAPGKQELDPEILAHARVVIDNWEQASHSGEINVSVSNGTLTQDQLYGDIGEIITGQKPGRESADQVTVFDSTGLAVQDIVVAKAIYDKIQQDATLQASVLHVQFE